MEGADKSIDFTANGKKAILNKVIEAEESQHTVDRIIYTDKRGMRKYDHSRMTSLAETFGRATRLETGFWDMGLNQDV